METVRWAAAMAVAGVFVAGVAKAEAPATPDPERLALARQVTQAVGGADGVVRAMRATSDTMFAQMRPDTAKQQADVAELQAYMQQRMEAYTPELLGAVERVYAQDFTTAQLRDILAFYRSPTGAAMAARLPEIARDSVVAMRPVTLKLQRDLLQKACAMTTCSDAQKATLAKLQAQAG